MNIGDLEPGDRAALLAGAQRVRLARGELAYSPGDRADRVFFVRSGRVKIVRTHVSGAEAIVGIRTAGDAFGELTGIDGGVRATSAIALESTEADAIGASAFAAAVEADVALARAFARGMARRLAAAEHELAELVGKSVAGRLIDVLGRLAAEHGVPGSGGTVRIGMNLTHKDLADLIGTSRETLTKELNVLADVGLLRVAHKTITLVQPQAFPFARRPFDERKDPQ
ncbi:MAG: family transcriptional regulator, cyclic receptor protein [Candidatus Eremiobacteraeota bacterium]|nr:family transcriptional regulator, cyclic receptor protein [Candidatus Eremiobacteraeota bacterium]